ncbi:hypothetical protein RLEG12_09915 (plasmid) [Rhizobium leguminosarum bv. trifolii CB782]|nr:hypothetical protein RLEG12_09915 [Rhizobium leguminosarum bv. trifolii CB782]
MSALLLSETFASVDFGFLPLPRPPGFAAPAAGEGPVTASDAAGAGSAACF